MVMDLWRREYLCMLLNRKSQKGAQFGGGHRESPEAVKAAFSREFGDEYQVSI